MKDLLNLKQLDSLTRQLARSISIYLSIALNAEIIKYLPIQDNTYGSDLML
jgi:hypothetical protein